MATRTTEERTLHHGAVHFHSAVWRSVRYRVLWADAVRPEPGQRRHLDAYWQPGARRHRRRYRSDGYETAGPYHRLDHPGAAHYFRILRTLGLPRRSAVCRCLVVRRRQGPTDRPREAPT